MTLSEHDLAQLLAQLKATAPAEPAPHATTEAPIEPATSFVVLVGAVTDGDLTHISLTSDNSWILA